MIELKVKAVSPLMGTKFPLPAYATAGAAAMDLCACMEEPVTLAPGGRQLIWSKHPLMSPSRIHSGDFPLFRSVKHCSIASCVLLPIRNP